MKRNFHVGFRRRGVAGNSYLDSNDFSFQRFFKGKAGYPKFQSIRKYSGWTYPDARQGFKVHSTGDNGYLELRDLGIQVQMRGKDVGNAKNLHDCLPQR